MSVVCTAEEMFKCYHKHLCHRKLAQLGLRIKVTRYDHYEQLFFSFACCND